MITSGYLCDSGFEVDEFKIRFSSTFSDSI